MLISLDTETQGIDFHFGARPFFVTICKEDGEQLWWEWKVDPLTRKVGIPLGDRKEILDLVTEADAVVLQNPKFDATALKVAGIVKDWPWEKTQDTLMASHLLASNQPHDLTSLALQYLGRDIQPYEDRLKVACNEARRYCRSNLKDWRIAKEGLPEMPSAKSGSKKDKKGVESESPWKMDCWLPKALAEERGDPEDHPWRTVLRDYSNVDSVITLALWKGMRAELEAKDLWEIYLTRIKLIPIVFEMEWHGVTVSKQRLDKLKKEFTEQSELAAGKCLGIAKGYRHELTLPKSGNNKSLTTFVFGKLKLPQLKHSGKTGAPSLDKEVLEEYGVILEGQQLAFIQALQGKRKRDTALAYMSGYERFWLPLEKSNGKAKEGNGAKRKEITADRKEGINSVGGSNRQFDSSNTGGGFGRCGRSRGFMGMIRETPEISGRGRVSAEDCGNWYVLHPSLNPTGTGTLRLSSSNPNSQNVSKLEDFNLRYAMGPAPGREWWAFDYENIELRIPAFLAGEKVMIELFEKPEEAPYFGSYHLMNASIVYPDLFWPIADKKGEFKKKYASSYYQWIKNFGFAVQYGAMPESGTADRAAHKRGAHRAVLNQLKELSRLNQETIHYANKYGYVETVPDRTVNPRRGYPIFCTRSEWGKILPTVPLNYLVQGTACWAAGKAMIRTKEYFDQLNSEDPRGYHLIMNVHDELDVDMPYAPNKGNLTKARKIKQLMEQSGDDIGIPLKVSITYHPNNWAEGEVIK